MRRIRLGQWAWACACALLALLACSRAPRAGQASGSAAASASVAAPTASAPPAAASVAPNTEAEPQLALRLDPVISASSVGDIGGPKRFRVMVTWPLAWHQRGIDEQVAEIGFPHTCEAFAADATRPWRVTCTPRYRKPVAEAFVEAGELVLRVLPERGAARLVRAPLDGHRFAPSASEVGSRPAAGSVRRKPGTSAPAARSQAGTLE